ncbi:MAG: LysR family transcriptional regulator, partial [Pseudomonadota bacterium]
MIINLPYSALRAFEAVVRHSGFSAAATELGVSQSAISQHVKSLEEWLGQELLVRGARR